MPSSEGTLTLRDSTFRGVGIFMRGEEKVPGRSLRSQISRFIRDAVAILIQFRVLVAELIFTAAALYGFYQMFRVLTH